MYSSLIGETSRRKNTCSRAAVRAELETTSAVVTPLAHSGYAGKSAMTAITSAGAASTTIDEVVCSAMHEPQAVGEEITRWRLPDRAPLIEGGSRR